jgi:DNA mismatch repair ATPase MutS
MKAFLLYPDQDFQISQTDPSHAKELTEDLSLDVLFDAMAGEDKFIHSIVRAVVLNGCRTPDDMIYRQDILKDCMAYHDEICRLYDTACRAEENREGHLLLSYMSTPDYTVMASVRSMETMLLFLRLLQEQAASLGQYSHSAGLSRFCRMICEELSQSYLDEMESYLKKLRFRQGICLNGNTGECLRSDFYELRDIQESKKSFWRRWIPERKNANTFEIDPRDESGFRALSEIRNQGMEALAWSVSKSQEHIFQFFKSLKKELSFYIGCLNLEKKLETLGAVWSFPVIGPKNTVKMQFSGLYQISLALHEGRAVSGNTVDASGKNLIIVTGANQGGKTTFLVSVGQAFLMMQCGMFVGAQNFSARVSAVYTHFKREEDESLERGKLDEELHRLSAVVDCIHSGDLILMNESLASTNEAEGSAIAEQVIEALTQMGIRVIFVTHFFQFSGQRYQMKRDSDLFLRANREADGSRSFRLVTAPPLTTSFGQDIYRKIFENADITEVLKSGDRRA